MKKTGESSWNCIQLSENSVLTQQQYTDISRLVFETDPYIYPAIFGDGGDGEVKAAEILPAVFESAKDLMFAKNNLFVLYNKEDVVGLILWNNKKMEWDPRFLLETAEEKGIRLNDKNIELVRKEYVDSRYVNEHAECISLINVCISKESRGFGAGTYLLKCFIKEHDNESMELAVLSDNTPAIKLYQRFGFKMVQEVDGFSLDSEKPKCLIMKREAL